MWTATAWGLSLLSGSNLTHWGSPNDLYLLLPPSHSHHLSKSQLDASTYHTSDATRPRTGTEVTDLNTKSCRVMVTRSSE